MVRYDGHGGRLHGVDGAGGIFDRGLNCTEDVSAVGSDGVLARLADWRVVWKRWRVGPSKAESQFKGQRCWI